STSMMARSSSSSLFTGVTLSLARNRRRRRPALRPRRGPESGLRPRVTVGRPDLPSGVRGPVTGSSRPTTPRAVGPMFTRLCAAVECRTASVNAALLTSGPLTLIYQQTQGKGVAMSNVDRRTFLGLLGVPAVAAALPQSLDKALAIPAHVRSGTIKDVEHVVFLMQENRSFADSFAPWGGVRGSAAPPRVTLRWGKGVGNQPTGPTALLPFRPDVRDRGKPFLRDPPHGWNDGHAMWNVGRFD